MICSADQTSLDRAMLRQARSDIGDYLSAQRAGRSSVDLESAASALRWLFGRTDGWYVMSIHRVCKRLGVDGPRFAKALWRSYSDEQRGHMLDLMDKAGIRLAI